MPDAFDSLAEFEWRGKQYPCTGRRAGFRHEQARHRLVYRSAPNGGVEYIEQLGPQVPTFNYSIPMREGIAKGPFKELFAKGLFQLWIDMQDPTPGVLVDPYLGPLTVVPDEYSDNLDPQKRDGADVDLQFSIFNEIDEEQTLAPVSLDGLVSDAGKLDEEVEKAFREQQKPSPQPSTNPLAAIAGAGAQLNRSRDRVVSGLAGTSAQLRKVENQIEELEDPINAELIRESRRLQLDAARLSEKAEPSRVVRVVTVSTAKSLAVIARDLGMTLVDFLKLNPSLAKSPTIPPGSSVTYYG